jgi:ribonucleoside-diphosphate reductase alpha chain
MPSTATIDEIKEAYRMGHDWGCKAIALYRDGSKLSQPLTIAAARKSPVHSSDIEIKIVSPDPISNRVRLGWYRQPGIDVAVEFGFGGKFYLRTTRYDDGKTAEIWATFSGSTGTVQDMLGSLCKTANVALQTGVPLEWICESWLSANFEPSGLVGSHPNIKSATSIPNLMARLLQFHELGETSNLNIQPVTNPIPRAVRGAIETIAQSPHDVANVQITGEKCPECGKALVQSGAGCKKCPSCGYAGGCG